MAGRVRRNRISHEHRWGLGAAVGRPTGDTVARAGPPFLVARAALERLPQNWTVFEATASAVNAGAVYVGQLEGRVEDLVERLKGKSVVWVLPALEEALYAGRYNLNPKGLLDHLLPHIQAGHVRIVA